MAKEEIARFEQFLLFSRCFQKASAAERQNMSAGVEGLNNKYHGSVRDWISHSVFNRKDKDMTQN